MDEALWPCRGVAEYAYCPRLFYYMAVEGIFIPSRDTEEGARVHKRVDKPSAKKSVAKLSDDEADPERPQSVRSLALTSERLGITGTLDLSELSGQTAIPVEYRKGKPQRRIPAPTGPVDDMMDEAPPVDGVAPWPTDRVQVGLQALLLEEAGYEVREAVLYYAAEKLRLRIRVDDALKSEALATLEAAKRAAAEPRPRR